MKKVWILMLSLILVMSLFSSCTGQPAPPVGDDNGQDPPVTVDPPDDFIFSSSGIVDGVLGDEFGVRGELQNGIPTRSPEITASGAPDGTACYALVMLDPDSVPLCGYEWLHWAVVFDSATLPEDASVQQAGTLIQATNDFGTVGYGGPTPPDKEHTYVITVYALDETPSLDNGFSLQDLRDAIEGHILAEAEVRASYAP